MVRRLSVLMQVLVLGYAPGCGHGCGGTRGAVAFDELALGADNGHRGSPMSLRIDSAGRVELYLGGPDALPGVEVTQVGHFATTLSPEERRALSALVADADIEDLDEPGGPLPSGDYTSLVLAAGGERHSRILWERPTAELEHLLARLTEIAAATLEHPWRAAEARMEPAENASVDGAAPRLVLAHRGTEPLPIVLFDPNHGGRFRVQVTVPAPGTPVPTVHQLPPERIDALVEAGRVPRDVIELAVGEEIVIPLDGLEVPTAPGAEGLLELWLAGPGLARSWVRLPFTPPS